MTTLSTAQKCALVAGSDTWHAAGLPEAGIAPLKVTDGPNGARGATFGQVPSACFPCGTALGATWDPELIGEVGAALGREARRKGAQVLLAPTVNIHRHPLAGRNFECPSEDPFLAAAYAAAYVAGVQREGVAAAVKHFVANDSEHERMSISSEVGERALREIYLAPFEAAVRAGAWAVMTAYNRVNGTFASEHADLVRTVLKEEWGFDGLVMSDWWGTHSTVAAARGGLDLEMPGPAVHFGTRLAAAVESGEVPVAVLDEMVRRRLLLAERVGAPAETEEHAVDDPADRALIRRAAAGGVVLLANDRGLLPLDGSGTVAVIGPFADTLAVQGGGSARVEPHRAVSLAAALAGRVAVRSAPGCRVHRGIPSLAVPAPGALLEYFAGPAFDGPPVATEYRPRLELTWLGQPVPGLRSPFSVRAGATLIPEETGVHTFSLISAGLSRLLVDGAEVVDNWSDQTAGTSYYGTGSTRVTGQASLVAGEAVAVVLEYRSPEAPGVAGFTVGCESLEPPDLLEQAVALAAGSDTAVVVVGTGHEWETEGRDRETMALPGRQDELVARVAAANPRTVVVVTAAAPVTMPWAGDVGVVLQAWLPGQEGGHAISDVLLGATDPGGRLPVTVPFRQEDCPADLTYPGEAGSLSYAEGVFVGYRGYRRRGIAPRFAFGHGLSYTTFDYGPVRLVPEVAGPGEDVVVLVAVTNTGARAGSEVVQVYVRDVESSLLRPDRELAGFAKVWLEPGARREVEITLGPRALAAWDPRAHDWVAEPGAFEVLVGSSSADIRGTASLELGAHDTVARPA